MDNILTESSLLIVDDTPASLDILVDSLGSIYPIRVATNGIEALEAVKEEIPDLILLDVVMPGMDGFEVCRRLKEKEETRDIPVLFLTALNDIREKSQGFTLGAADYITKPFDTREVRMRVETHLSAKLARSLLKDENHILEELVKRKTVELQNTQDVAIFTAASLAETRDKETGNHLLRTQAYIRILAENAAKGVYREILDSAAIERIVKSSPLHDIGKVGIPDKILLKPGRLTEEEFNEMKHHTVYGRDTLLRAVSRIKGTPFLDTATEIAYTHHEKWNGRGYPQQLKGEEIPISGRLMAIADVYDALISKRVYKDQLSHNRAVEIIREDSGTSFDPELVLIFLEHHEEFRDAALSLAESEEEKKTLCS